jgi:hypothetical protein
MLVFAGGLLLQASTPVVCVAQTAPAPPSAGIPAAKPVVLFDLAHGQTYLSAETGRETPMQKAYLDMVEWLGGEMRISTRKLSPDTLAGVRTLVVLGPTEPLEQSEIEAIAAFVSRGGGLMVGLDEERRQSLTKSRANDVLAPFKLAFTADTAYIHNRGAAAPPGRIHPALREVPYSGGRAVEGGTPFSFILEADGTPTKLAHAAWMETAPGPDGGRVIAMGDLMAPLLLGSASGSRLHGALRPNDFSYWGKDSRDMMLEILSWLTYRMR